MKTLLKHNFKIILKNTVVIYFIFLVLGLTARAIFPAFEEKLLTPFHIAAMLFTFVRFIEISPQSYEKWSSLIPLNNDQLNKLYNITCLLFSSTLLLIYLPSCLLYEGTGMEMKMSIWTTLTSVCLYHIAFLIRKNKHSSSNHNIFLSILKLKRSYLYLAATIGFSFIFINLQSFLLLLVFLMSILLIEHLVRNTHYFNLKIFSLNNFIPMAQFLICTFLLFNVTLQSKKSIIEDPSPKSLEDLFLFTGVTSFIYSDTDIIKILESPMKAKGFAYLYVLFHYKYPQDESRDLASHSSKRLRHTLNLDYYKTLKSKKEFIPFLYTLNFFTQAEMDQEKVDYYILRSKKFDLIQQQMALRYLKNFVQEESKDQIDNLLTSFHNNCHKVERINEADYEKFVPKELYSFEYCSF